MTPMPSTKRSCAVIGLTLVMIGGATARAEDIEAARQHYQQGSKQFDLGLYDKAIQEYMAAYDAKPDPALLYNIAQAHKLAGHAAEAIRFYRVYLMRVRDAPNGDEVRAKIAELQRAIDQQKKAQTMPPDQTKPLGSIRAAAEGAPGDRAPGDRASGDRAPTGGAAEPASPAATTTAPGEPNAATVNRDVPAADAIRPSRAMKIAGITAGAVGVATLIAGIGLSVVAKQDADQLTASAQQQQVFDPSKDRTGRTLGAAGPALIGVGAVVTVAGTIVAILGVRASRSKRMASASEVRF